jgi:hypothetical protein
MYRKKGTKMKKQTEALIFSIVSQLFTHWMMDEVEIYTGMFAL